MKNVTRKLIFYLVCMFTLAIPVSGGTCTNNEIIGYIENFDGENLRIFGEEITTGTHERVVIHISDAPIYDLLTGFRMNENAIREGISARAAYTAAQYEPYDALAIWLNWDDDNAAVFSVVVSGNISHSADSCIFISCNGKYRVTISPETDIICPRHGRLTHAQIRPEQEFFVWVDMITASNPAEVYPDKIVLIE